MTAHDPELIQASPLDRPGPLLRLGLLCAGTGFASVFMTLGVAARVDRPVFLWPVTGVIVAILLPFASQQPKRKFALYLCGAAGVFAGGAMVGMSYRFAAFIALLTTIDLLVTGALLVPEIRCFDDLKQRQNILRFVAATVVAPVLTGLLGAGPVSHVLRVPIPDVAFISTLANAIGIAFLVPLILLLRTPKGLGAPRLMDRGLRPFLLMALFLLVATAVFWQNKGPYLFVIFPPMILMLLETGLEGAVFAAFVLSGIGWFATAHGHGPICLVKDTLHQVRLETLQTFIWLSAMTALPVGAVVDERKKAEQKTKKAESIRQLLLKYASEVTVLSSLDGTERHVSPNIQSLAGWTPEEYLSQDRFSMVHPDDRQRARTLLGEFRLGTVRRFRYRLLQKHGDYTWAESTVRTFGEDKVDGYVATIRDISDLVETETQWNEERQRFNEEQRRLAEAEEATQLQLRLRDEFLSNVSHELRSPLASIYSFTTILDDGLAGQPSLEQKEYLGIVLKNVVQLQSMIEDLLTVTRSKEGKLNIQVQPTSISEAVSDVVRNLEITARKKAISLSWSDQHQVPDVMADPVRLKQVLTILIDNALKFTPENGSVDVSLREVSKGFVMARVSDTGCGIPREKWTKVFEKLYQVSHDDHPEISKAAQTGLGLGLHIAKTLIAGQGGQIWVTSVPQAGSIFHFTLPIFRERRSVANVTEQLALNESS